MEGLPPLATVRATPEVILWALAVFVCGVVILPGLHLAHHADDHDHGALAAHLRAHAAGEAHDHGVGHVHGAGDAAHFGLALLDAEPFVLEPPVGEAWVEAAPSPGAAPPRRNLLTPIRPGAP